MAPTRSSSMSTSSSKSSVSQDGGVKKKFSCTFPACGKSFSRSEHLHRHALNHKDGNNTCMRCSAHFRRRDLLGTFFNSHASLFERHKTGKYGSWQLRVGEKWLMISIDRHMARHKEKDDEAGGEGLGVLATRKRLWRDETGKIVNARRPSYVQENGSGKRRQIRKASNANEEDKIALPRMKTRRAGIAAGETIVVDTGNMKREDGQSKYAARNLDLETPQDSWLQMTALPSPTNNNTLSPSSSEDADQEPELDTLYDDFYPSLSSHSSISTNSQNSPIESSYPAPSWGPTHSPFQTFMGAVSSSPDDDLSPPLSPSHHNPYSSHQNNYSYPSHPSFLKSESQMSTLDFENSSLGRNLYDWAPQSWNGGNVSRCREEKWDPRESLTLPALGMAGMAGGFGMVSEGSYGSHDGLKRGWSVVR